MENKRKGILFITHEIDIHGASKMLIQLVDSLEDEFDIYVMVPGKGDITKILENKNCKIFTVPYYLSVEPYRGNDEKEKFIWLCRQIRYLLFRRNVNYVTAKKMANIVKKSNIELIHSNSSSIMIGCIIAKLSGRKHIWHFREFLYEDFKLKPLLGWEKLYKAASDSDAVICVSNAIYNKYYDKIKTNIVKIYDGIENQNNNIIRNEHCSLNLLQAGVLSKGKGTDIAIKALSVVLKAGYSDIELYLAGQGDLEFMGEITPEVKKHIHVLGFVEDMQKCREENQIDVELVCSISEGFGLVSIEAMRAHNPVIGANSAGTKEIVIDKITGLLFEAGNFNDLADKIIFSINHRELMREYGENGYKRFQDVFSSDICCENTKKLYESIGFRE